MPLRAMRGATAWEVVGLVSMQLGRAEARAARSTAWPHAGWDRLDQGLKDTGVVEGGGRELDRQRDALTIHDQVILGTELPAVGGVAAGGFTPFFARTLVLSKLARSQSMAPASPSQVRIVWCSRSHTPAACHSRTRRQQVIPLP
jgi:hypothetical protein